MILNELSFRVAVDEMEVRDSNNITLKKGESFKFYLHSQTDMFDYPVTPCQWQPPKHDNYTQCTIHNVDEETQWASLGGEDEVCGDNVNIRYYNVNNFQMSNYVFLTPLFLIRSISLTVKTQFSDPRNTGTTNFMVLVNQKIVE